MTEPCPEPVLPPATEVGHAEILFTESCRPFVPVLTLFGRRDEGMGTEAVQSLIRDRVVGAAGQPHHAYDDAGHFIQEDKGEDLARRVVDFIAATPH